jgi:glutamyl-tRNA synthetase
MTTPRVRFAPSPTGRLHIGNIRPAVMNWLFARKSGGAFILRFDDTDLERSKEEFVDGAREDLRWLGLTWAEEHRQSQRFTLYDEAADRLKKAGRLYPCYETPEELERKRKRQAARGLPPVYDRAALKLTDADRAALEAEGRKPHWRFMLDQRPTAWDDLVRGLSEIDAASVSDPVLIREDGTPLYTFTSVADDADMGITHIIRGEDHVTNTAVQIQIFEALSAPVPVFAHHNLLVGPDGGKLSKRLGALSLQELRDGGYEALAVMCHASLIGTSEALRPVQSLGALADLFDFGKISRAPARFDPAELAEMNAKLLHAMPYEAVADRLAERGVGGGEAFWNAARANLAVFADVDQWWRIVTGPVLPVIEDADFLAKATGMMPPEPWDGTTWKTWTDALKMETGRKGRALFHPLRLALTGLDHGPDLKDLLPLIGRQETLRRLQPASK